MTSPKRTGKTCKIPIIFMKKNQQPLPCYLSEKEVYYFIGKTFVFYRKYCIIFIRGELP